MLLDNGDDPNKREESGHTPLFISAKLHGNFEERLNNEEDYDGWKPQMAFLLDGMGVVR
jgi:hypothetical protein